MTKFVIEPHFRLQEWPRDLGFSHYEQSIVTLALQDIMALAA